jgi:peptidoglycan DL-endopeptidase CwlO
MRRLFFYSAILAFCLLAPTYQFAHGDATSTLESQIKDRADKLSQLNQEIAATQSTLQVVQQQKSSLQNEVKSLDTSIKQLGLNIQADAVTNQKLGFEIQSLKGNIEAISASIDQKRTAVASLFRQMEKSDGENVFTLLLGNKTLAESLLDAQSVENLRVQLDADVVKLNQLSDDYHAKVDTVSQKKTEVALHQENLKNRAVIVADQKNQRQAVLAETKNQESIYQDKIAKLKQEQNALQDEITQIENQLGQNFNNNVLPTKRSGVLAWPLATVRITQHFGTRSSLYRGKPHNGLDLAAPLGTPVFAAADGVVMAVDDNDQSAFRKYQYGRYVLIRHPNNLATLYGHLSRQVVSPGQAVKRGDLIGYSGSTGYATGPHLHLGLYWAPSIELKSLPPAAGLVPVGVVLNPEDYL